MSTEITYLAWISGLTALMWVPYILNMIVVRGVIDAVGYPKDPKPLAPWAERMRCAHYNAVENLVVFAALVLAATAAGISNDAIAISAIVYFWARAIHFVVYTFAIPWVRTISFVVGFACQIVVASQIIF